MKHRFKHICPNAAKLLKDCNKIGTFMGRVEKCSTDADWLALGWTPDEYKGDALEALVEVLVIGSRYDKRINIVDYRPHDNKADGNDMGIDGYGMSHCGNLHTIQVKYRSVVMRDLTANQDHISNFVAKTTSSQKYRDADMTIFTTAKGLNKAVAENMYHDRVRVVGHNELRKLIDDNRPFWDDFRNAMGV